jgi:hypothetical protein
MFLGAGIMVQRFRFLLLIVGLCGSVALFSPQVAFGKDLTNRLGVGYKDQFAPDSSIPSLAVQYYPGADIGFSGSIGVDTVSNNSRFGAMAKLYRIIFQEDNLNFYMGAGAGLLSTQVDGTTSSGFELMAYGGAEFFLPGLENLGFSFEAGTAIDSTGNGTRFRTFGDSPLRAGMIFYF